MRASPRTSGHPGRRTTNTSVPIGPGSVVSTSFPVKTSISSTRVSVSNLRDTSCIHRFLNEGEDAVVAVELTCSLWKINVSHDCFHAPSPYRGPPFSSSWESCWLVVGLPLVLSLPLAGLQIIGGAEFDAIMAMSKFG